MSMLPPCEVVRLGRVDYKTALALQNRLVERRGRDEIPDRLLLLEHDHTYTLGTSADEAHLLMSEAEREQRGVRVYRIDRGGDITYHGPGQVVGYPIMRLQRSDDGLRTDFIGHVRRLEQVIMHTLADFGIEAYPIQGLTGVWVATPDGEAKVAAIGVRINVRGVTKHGFGLNLNADLSYFDGIVPCGIHDKGVTSMARLLGHPVDEDAVIERLVEHFGAVFGCHVHWRDAAEA